MNIIATVTIICVINILIFLYYQLQKRIGEDQSRDWKEYIRENQHLFKKNK